MPSGPINDLRQVFDDPHVQSRKMRLEIMHSRVGTLPILAQPIRFSETPPVYERAPPSLGEHTNSVLTDELGLSVDEIESLAADRVI